MPVVAAARAAGMPDLTGRGGYDHELAKWEVDLLGRAGTHAMGRYLCKEMADYWPSSTEVWAAPMNEIPKVVFSRTLKHADWKKTRIRLYWAGACRSLPVQ